MSTGTIHLAPSLPAAPFAAAALSSRIETITDAASFASLKDEWGELLAASRSNSIFLTWEWLHTWWTHLSGEQRLAILTLRRGPELVAIAPLAFGRTNLLGIQTLGFLGTGRVGSDYLDIIVRRGAEEESVPAIANHLARIGAILDMRQLRITSSEGSTLARELRRSGCPVRATRTHRCPVIDLGGRSFENYLGSLGAEHRYNFQRKLRRLEKQHDLTFECVASEERRREVLPILFELHRLRWSERGGSDGLVGAQVLAFHEELTRLALERGWLRLFVLWLGGAPAATLYGFRYGSVFSFYQSGFDPGYRKLSVGSVALGLAIRSATLEGVTEFDLLHGEEPYKFHWAKRTRRLGRILAFPGGPLGRLSWVGAAAADVARGLARKLARAPWTRGAEGGESVPAGR